MDVSALKKLPAKYLLIILLVLGILGLVVIKLLSADTSQQETKPFQQSPLPKPPSSSIPLPSVKTPSFPLPSSEPTPAESTKSKERGDPNFEKSISENLFKQFPLLKNIPYKTSEFKVIYSKPLQLTVELQPNVSTQSAEIKVLNWIQSKGINPSTHEIIFK